MRRLLLLAALALAGAAPSAPAATWSVLGAWPATGHGVLRFPQAIAYAPGGGQVFVGDMHSGVVQRFSRDGVWEADIGFTADSRERGRFGVLGGLAVDRDGHLFVLDSEHDRVQVLDARTGAWLGQFGRRGSAPGELALGRNTGSGGIALAQAAPGAVTTLFIADQQNHRVQAFVLSQRTSGGARVLPPGARVDDVVDAPQADRVWGRRGDCAATGCASVADRSVLSYPQGLAVHPETGHVLVADDRNHRVVEFTPEGRWVRQVGSFGEAEGQFRFPYDVGIDAGAPRRLYVADNNNHRVQAFDAGTLAFAGGWGSFGHGPAQFGYLRSLAAVADDPAGGVAVADTANDRVQAFAPDGAVTASWGVAGRGPGYVTRPRGVAVDADGRVHVADTQDSRVQHLAADGAYLGQTGYVSANSGFAAPASGDGQFDRPHGIAWDPRSGHLWVADTANDRVQELTASGGWVATHTGFSGPRSVAVTEDGAVLVADTGNDRVRRRDPVSGAWSTLPLLEGLDAPGGVAPGPLGSVVVSDTGGDRVLVVTPVGLATVLDGFSGPTGLAVRGTTAYVSDTGTSRVLRVDLLTGAQAVVASEGAGIGSVVAPTGLALSRDGRVLVVADTGLNRVQRLDLGGDAPRPASYPPPPPAADAPAPAATAPAPAPAPVAAGPAARPRVLRAALTPRRFRRAAGRSLLVRTRARRPGRRGALLTVRLSRAATLVATAGRARTAVRLPAGTSRLRLTGRGLRRGRHTLRLRPAGTSRTTSLRFRLRR